MSTELHHMISLEELEDNKFKGTITFDGDLVKKANDRSAKIVNQSVKVNGFRQGKVPLKVLKQFHPEKISGGALNMMMEEGFRIAIQENRIMPLRDPKLLKINSYPDEEDGFEFEIEFDGMYEIDPVGYLNMELETSKYEVEESVDEYVKYMKAQNAKSIPAEEVGHGMNIKCDYAIKLGENSIGEDKDQLVPVYDTELTIFGSQLVGAKVGDTVEYNYTLPKDFPENPGEEVTIVVDIKEILERKEPTMEELCEEMGVTEEEIMKFAKTQVEQSLERNKRQELNEQIVDKLLEANEFTAPKILVDEELGIMTEHDCHGYGDCGHDHEDEHDHEHDSCECDGDCDDYGDDCKCKEEDEKRKVAERTVKSAYLLNRIYNMEPSLELTNEEIDAALEMEAQMRGTKKQLLLKQIKQANAMSQFVGGLRNRKIMSFIMSSATITEREQEVEDEQVEEKGEERGEENGS